MWRFSVIVGLVWCLCASAAEVIPPAPKEYFNDYAGVVSPATAQRLNRALEDFEKQTSSQIMVVIYPKMQSDSSIEDYTVRVFDAWKPGLKHKDNGAILFVFVQDRKLRIATGYGLEGALPDALCKRIIDEVITPRLRQGDFDGAMTAGVAAMMATAKGEYTGTGRTEAQGPGGRGGHGSFLENNWFLLVILLILLLGAFGRRRRTGYGGGWMMGSGGFGGWSGGGGWTGGGDWGGGGGGGFSGGGGRTGGGGASGSW
jgi:uncharacterized protein